MPMRSRSLRRVLTGVSTAFAALGGAAVFVPAHAAIETVVITAQRREEDIQKAPIAVTEIGADELAKSNVNHLDDINGLVPSLTINPSAGFETAVTIRGVGDETPENALTTSPGVALYEDGAYVANSVALDQTLFDLQNVQVLRGPQGALYGQSADGGAILLVSKQPDLDKFWVTANASYGSYNLNKENADVNIPVTDDIAVLVAGQHYGHDGYTRDNFFPNVFEDDAEDWVGKFAAMWKPSSNFTATVSTEFYHAYQQAAAQKNINDPNPSPYVITQDFVPRFDMATDLEHLNIDWNIPDWFLIKSVTAYQWLANVQGEDSSRSAFSILHTYDDVAAWNTWLANYNEEFDIQSNGDGPLDWTVGTFLLAQKSKQFVVEFECNNTSISCAAFPPTPANLAVTPGLINMPTGNIGYGNLSNTNRKSWAIFGQATYHLTDELSVTGGARINSDSYTDVFKNFFFFGSQKVNTHRFTDHVTTWVGRVDWQATPENLLYASANRGFKPGGVNGENGQAVVCTNPAAFLPFFSYAAAGCDFSKFLVTPNVFKPETNTAFEVGSKNVFLDGQLVVNLAGFYYFYNDYQYITTDPVPFDGGMTNIPSTHVWGGELEATYSGMDDRLRLHGDASFEGGEIRNYKAIDSTVANTIEASNPACAFGGAFFNPICWYAVFNAAKNVSGNPPAKMPSVLGSIDGSYDFTLPWGVLTPRAQVVYRGSYWARIFDEAALDRVPASTVVNLYAQFAPNDSNFLISLAATNVGSEKGVANQYTDPYGTGQTSRQFIPPTEVVGTISYKY